MKNKNVIGKLWGQMFSALLIAFPKWVLNRLQAKATNQTMVIKAIPFLIVALSITSIFIIDGKVSEYHGGMLGFGIGLAVACLVPVGVLAAMLIDSKWALVFWGLSALFAGISGTIQYTTYHNASKGQFDMLLAIALGYGLPVSEVALAIMEACLIAQHNRKLAHEEQQAKAAVILNDKLEQERAAKLAQAKADQLAQTKERELQAQREALKLQQELAEHNQKLAQDQALFTAKLDILKHKAYAKTGKKLADQSADKLADQPIVPAATGVSANQPINSADKSANSTANYNSQLAMLTWYTVEPTLSDAKVAERLGKSKQYAQRLLADLADKEVVEIVKMGKGKRVTVNGKYEAFKRGELHSIDSN